jgi:hypothetical protein
LLHAGAKRPTEKEYAGNIRRKTIFPDAQIGSYRPQTHCKLQALVEEGIADQ